MGKAFFLAKRRKCRLWPCCCGPALCRHCPVPGCHRLSCLREGGPRPTPFCPMSWPSRSELSSGSNRLFPWTNFNQRPLLFLSCQVTSDFCDSNTLATWCEELTLWKRPWCWQRLRTGAGNRRWDGWMASSTQWTWVWVNPGRWWRTRKCFSPWVAKSRTRLSNWTITMYYSPPGSFCPWNFPGKNTGVGCHFLLQWIFLTQGSNLCLLHWQVDSLPLCH